MAADDDDLEGLWGWDGPNVAREGHQRWQSQEPPLAPTESNPPSVPSPTESNPPDSPSPLRSPSPERMPSADESKSRSRILVASVIGVMTVALVIVGYVVSTHSRDHSASTSPPPTGRGQTAGNGSEGTTDHPADTSDVPASAQDPQQDALPQLQARREEDLAQVTLNGRWVAQLASKYVGIRDPYQIAENGSHTFYASDILAEHQALRGADNRGATIVLLLSTDYGRQLPSDVRPLWVTLALGSFGSSSAVQTWCTARFPNLTDNALTNACLPRRLLAP